MRLAMGQQLDRAHLAHVHTHRVGSPAGFCFHSCQSRSSFFCGNFVRGVFTRIQQLISIRCVFVYGDTHVVDHADDVFDLIRIRDFVRQVIVHLSVGDVALLFAFGDEFLKTRLLFLSAHITSVVTCIVRRSTPSSSENRGRRGETGS